MWAGPSGAGKSTACLNYVHGAKVPTLYVSCDMPPRLMMSRTAAIHTGTPERVIYEEMETPEGLAKWSAVLDEVDWVYTSYLSRPSGERLARAQMAFMEVFGVPSPLMVVDNLMNLSHKGEDEFKGFRDNLQILHWMATQLKIVVLVLHHINVGGIDLTRPAPIDCVKGKVDQLQATIITLASQPGELSFAVVKNRHGPADPSARVYSSLAFDAAVQRITDKVADVPGTHISATSPVTPNPWYSRKDREVGVVAADWKTVGLKDP